jgi:hypothetical protein
LSNEDELLTVEILKGKLVAKAESAAVDEEHLFVMLIADVEIVSEGEKLLF